MGGKDGHGFIGKDTVGTATVGNNGLAGRHLTQTSGQFVNRDRAGLWQMAGGVFERGAHIEDDNGARIQPLAQVINADSLQRGTVSEKGLDDLAYIGELGFAHRAEGEPEILN